MTLADAYALWAEQYPPRPHNPLMQVEQDVMAPILASTSPCRALDVGTGTGRYLPLLLALGARVVVGVDLSMPMLRRIDVATRRVVAGRVCGDACSLPFKDGSFDLVSSSLMVGDVAWLPAWIDEMARILAPGGHLVYSDFHPSWRDRQWRRTFQAADGRCIELPYFPHTLQDHRALLEARSFDVRAIHEPRLMAPTRMRRRKVPVAVVCHAVKAGR